MAAGDDPLRDDSLHLAEALKARGRDVRLAVVEHENHGFLHRAATSPCASDAIKQVVRWIDGLSERH
jgi:acetyl esterase/lipase